jgi:hypothetical protein
MKSKIQKLISEGYSLEEMIETYKQEKERIERVTATKINAARVRLAAALADYFNLALDMHTTPNTWDDMIQDLTHTAKIYLHVPPTKAEVSEAEKSIINVDNVRTMDELEEWLKSMGL